MWRIKHFLRSVELPKHMYESGRWWGVEGEQLPHSFSELRSTTCTHTQLYDLGRGVRNEKLREAVCRIENEQLLQSLVIDIRQALQQQHRTLHAET